MLHTVLLRQDCSLMCHQPVNTLTTSSWFLLKNRPSLRAVLDFLVNITSQWSTNCNCFPLKNFFLFPSIFRLTLPADLDPPSSSMASVTAPATFPWSGSDTIWAPQGETTATLHTDPPCHHTTAISISYNTTTIHCIQWIALQCSIAMEWRLVV